MAKRVIPADTMRTRFATLKPVFNELGIDEKHLVVVAKRANVHKSIQRLRKLVELEVPIKGLSLKVGMADSEFEELVKRHRNRAGFNSGQKDLFELMISNGISERVAKKIAGGFNYHRFQIPEKIKFFESIELDPKVYGVSKIPPKYYEKVLDQSLFLLKKGIKRGVLQPLANDYASRMLDRVLPGWRDVKSFNLKNSPISSSKILQRVVELLQRNIEPRTDYILGSLEKAERVAKRGRTNLSKLSQIRKNGAKGKVNLKDKTELRLSVIESRIVELRKQILSLSPGFFSRGSKVEIAELSIHPLREELTQLVDQRNKLL
ncbi:MAG: hypothetical protein WC915_05235 [archaeon]|jgi:hypothetical protein